MESEIDKDFTMVKRKKKKARIDLMNKESPSSDHATQSDGSTSSTNTSSMNSDDPRRTSDRRKGQSTSTSKGPVEVTTQQPEILQAGASIRRNKIRDPPVRYQIQPRSR